jgi:hypothetical protein
VAQIAEQRHIRSSWHIGAVEKLITTDAAAKELTRVASEQPERHAHDNERQRGVDGICLTRVAYVIPTGVKVITTPAVTPTIGDPVAQRER